MRKEANAVPEFKNVSFSYGGKAVLKNFSLDIKSGEKTALLGVSGCGKTTLLHLTAGLYKPDSGKICGELGKCSFVFQENRLLPWYTSAENLTAVGISPEKAAEYLLKTGLGGCENLLPEELSGGMQRRLAIARALAFGGDSFFFDEPLQGLDPKTAEEILTFIQSETAGKTVLLVTHSEAEADFLCERKIFLGGNPLEIINDIKK